MENKMTKEENELFWKEWKLLNSKNFVRGIARIYYSYKLEYKNKIINGRIQSDRELSYSDIKSLSMNMNNISGNAKLIEYELLGGGEVNEHKNK